MNDSAILGIRIGTEKIKEILERANNRLILKRQHNFYHLVNLNPDIFVLAYKDGNLRKIINEADSILIDGIGIKMAAWLFGVKSGERMTGTDLMQLLVKYAAENAKKVMFLGGRQDTAELTGQYFKKVYPSLDYIADSGALNIKKEAKKENNKVLNLINKFQPDLLLVAYGPPYQEKWIDENRDKLAGIVCMGVGGSFNFFAGKTWRSPKWIAELGFEWLWRFIFEPIRIRKLPRHLYFVFIVVKAYLQNIMKKI